nr:protein hid1 [Quercus suber]
MGNSESKLGFKQDVFALVGETCPLPTHNWWTRFYTLPESADDVFTLFGQHDIRALTTNPSNPRTPKPNLETLIYLCVARLQAFLHEPDDITGSESVVGEVLNCIRLLTRCLPYIYELDALKEWEDGFFWQARRAQQVNSRLFVDGLNPTKTLDGSGEEIGRPLGHVLLGLLIRYLFTPGFTLPKKIDENGVPQVKTTWSIWNSGIGCKRSAGMTKENERNAAEVLALLLVLCSRQMYLSPGELSSLLSSLHSTLQKHRLIEYLVSVADSTVPALRYLTTEDDRQIVLTVLCSLMNTVLKYNPSSWLVKPVADDSRARMVQLSLQFLILLTVYSSTEPDEKNEYRHQLGRIHKPEDLQFVHQGITTALQSIASGVTSYVPAALKLSNGSPESIIFLWEMIKTNKRFRSFIVETDRAHDLIVMVLCCAVEAKDDMAKHGVLRLCILLLQTLSQDKEFATRLNMPLAGAESLPARLKITNFHGSYADFLILRATSIRLLSWFSALANTDYLYHRRDNPQNLIILLDAFSRILECNPKENPRFVEALLRAQKQIYALRDFTVDGAHAELDRQAQRRKDQPTIDTWGQSRNASIDSMRSPASQHSPSSRQVPGQNAFAIGDDDDEDAATDDERDSEATPRALKASTSAVSESTAPARNISEKARGKQPANRSQQSRKTSLSRTTSTNTSTASLSALLTAAQAGAPHQFMPSQAWLETWIPYLPLHTILEFCNAYQNRTRTSGLDADSNFVSSLVAQNAVDSSEMSESQESRSPFLLRAPISMSWYLSLIWGVIFAADAVVHKGIRGIWTGTVIKLFNIESREQAITLRSPKGAVDALGNTIAQRLGNLSFNPRDGQQQQQQPVTTRERRSSSALTESRYPSLRNDRPETADAGTDFGIIRFCLKSILSNSLLLHHSRDTRHQDSTMQKLFVPALCAALSTAAPAPLENHAANPTVTIASGVVVGTATQVSNQPSITALANSYLGIPFAESPPLRFAPPSAPRAWFTPLHAQTLPPSCPQQFSKLFSSRRLRDLANVAQ